MRDKLEELTRQASEEIKRASDSKVLYELKVKLFGKTGEFSALMKNLSSLAAAERPLFGKQVNEAKANVEAIYNARELELKNQEQLSKIMQETLDLTIPGPHAFLGSVHPTSRVIYEIVDILSRLGFAVRSGPMIESDWYNFEALNIPKDHPARDMQDTFYVDDTHVLRTHTSPIQIRTMETEAPPLRILAPGSVFRCDSDASHSPNFHQIEGLVVDTKVSMADLKGTISFFVKEFFGKDLLVRFRPSFFPFTEPSAEVDCGCPICSGKGCRMCGHSGWVEIGGCGLVNPKVFDAVKIDSKKWQGYAFGFGIERMAIIKYGIGDIRLFSDNDVRFLGQFPL